MAKTVLDRFVAGLGLGLSAPILAVAAVAIAVSEGRPVLFHQERVGSRGRPFKVTKFRTMRVNSYSVTEVGHVGADHDLVTPIGRILRRFKVDELPQLANVLRGDMSLVGPRPTVPEQVAKYGPWELRRLEVRPGITGWAQVNGNVDLTWDDRIALDIWYLDHWSHWLDIRILVTTAKVLVKGDVRNDSALREALAHADSIGWRGRKHGTSAENDGRGASSSRCSHHSST